MGSSEASGPAPDKPHHPPDPNLNFTWLYVSIIIIFVLAVGVKVSTVIAKKRRDRRHDPAMEMQNLDRLKRHWFPWRYINGNDGQVTGESVIDLPYHVQDVTLPQTPQNVYYRNSVLERLAAKRNTHNPDRTTADPQNNTDDPLLMSGANGYRSSRNSSNGSNLSSTDSRILRAGISNESSLSLVTTKGLDPTASIASASGAPQLPPLNTGGSIDPTEVVINPYTGRPGGPYDRSDLYTNRFNTSRFNDNQFGRSLSHKGKTSGPRSALPEQQTFKSDVPEGEVSQGYGAPPAWEREHFTTAQKPHSRHSSSGSNMTQWPEYHPPSPKIQSSQSQTYNRPVSSSTTRPKDTNPSGASSSSSTPSYLRQTASSSSRLAPKPGFDPKKEAAQLRANQEAARKAKMPLDKYVDSLRTPEQREADRLEREEVRRMEKERRDKWAAARPVPVEEDLSVDEAFAREVERRKREEKKNMGIRDLIGKKKK